MELFDIDEFGNVSADTPPMFDYKEITDLHIIRNDDFPITILGGEFTTIACDTLQNTNYYISRGIGMKRSNVTIKNMKHYVVGELDWDGDVTKPRGCSYSGFLAVEDCQDVLLLDCTITARRYQRISGTYEMGAYRANSF